MNRLVLKLIYYLMYHYMTFSVIVKGSQYPSQIRTTVVPQESSLSSILLNRFIQSLLQTLNWQNSPFFPSALFFADDGVLISPISAKAHRLLNQALLWADQHAMSFNFPNADI